MAKNNFLENLTKEQEKLGVRIFDLILGRVFKRVYNNLDEQGRDYMGKVFLIGNEEQKEEFLQKFVPDFQEIFKEEAQKIEKELKERTENKI